MKILMLGYSNFAIRRMLPAAIRCEKIASIDIATRDPGKITERFSKLGTVYDDYSQALESTNAEIVYVSLINSLHAQWVKSALHADKHVIVDKPASTDFDELHSILALAEQKKRLVCEATLWPFHNQISEIKKLFAEQDKILRISATFSVPPFASHNFRLKKELGGGAIWDLGPYAVSIGRVFFEENPKEMFVRIVSQDNSGLESAFSILMTYSSNRSLVGHFGIDTTYINQLKLFGEKIAVDINRVFSTPPEFENTIMIHEGSTFLEKSVPPSDTFETFLHVVLNAIQKNDHSELRAMMLEDATNLQKLRKIAFDRHSNKEQ